MGKPEWSRWGRKGWRGFSWFVVWPWALSTPGGPARGFGDWYKYTTFVSGIILGVNQWFSACCCVPDPKVPRMVKKCEKTSLCLADLNLLCK